MLNAHFKPLAEWSGDRTPDRKQSQFSATWLQTLNLLEYELNKLEAFNVVIQIEDPEQHKRMRNDGSMTVSDKYWPTKPGVVLTFQSPKGDISMPCDRYPHWRDNLRAVALSLQALRAVDRYGVTRGNEQYRGWAQLEAPANGKMDRDQAASFIAGILQISPADVLADPVQNIRAARFRTHPDRGPYSDVDKFTRIPLAEEALGV